MSVKQKEIPRPKIYLNFYRAICCSSSQLFWTVLNPFATWNYTGSVWLDFSDNVIWLYCSFACAEGDHEVVRGLR